MVSLAALWRSHGVEPAAVVGHSQGEVAAACVAGALSLEDAARVAALRAKALEKIAGRGGMVSVSLAASEALELIGPWGERLSLAAENGPESVVVSGDPGALEELLGSAEDRGIRARAVAVDYASHSRQIEELREEILAALAPVRPRDAEVPLFSTLTGGPLEGTALGAEHWYGSLREPVRFATATAALLDDGIDAFVEVGPHPVLSPAVQESAEAAGREVATIATLRREDGGPRRVLTALAQAHVEGIGIDWGSVLPGPGADPGTLPTYPFRRSRYWLDAGSGQADAAALGQAPTGHPLLGAATTVAGSDQVLFSGRLARRSHPWIADHVVQGVAILPGTAFLEMALRAAAEVGLGRIEELTLNVPLPLPERDAVALQVGISGPDGEGRRALEIHSRPEAGTDAEEEWTLHAAGSLAPAPETEPGGLGEWPPSGAEPVDVKGFYEHAADLGVEFGPSFRGVRAAWRRGSELFVESDPTALADSAPYLLHPARMDAALHALFLDEESSEAGPRVPFVWRDVSVHGDAKGVLRTRMAISEEEVSYLVADELGAPVFSVDSLTVRRLDGTRLTAAGGPRSLFALDWVAVDPTGLDGADGAPEVLELLPDPALDPATAARELCGRGLDALHMAIAAGTRLAFLTRGAQAVRPGEVPDAAAASLWGLVRSAQAEHPGLFALLDLEGEERADEELAAALALTATEPQLGLRRGALLAPRLVAAEDEAEGAPALDPDRTVLITGGTGGIGALLARHLVEAHDARRLLLVGRRGPAAEGVAALRSELEELGAQVEVRACDVSEREQLAELIATIPAGHPLGAVFHCAAVFDNALIGSLDQARIDRVLAPKADAAWHLHELTAGLDLSHFVLFSSVAATFNNPGQGNYAAANAFLDALAVRRQAEGAPATAVAWGLWERGDEGGDERLGGLDLERLARDGVLTMTAERALALLDRVLARTSPFVVASPLDMAVLRTRGKAGTLAPLLSGLVPVKASRQGGTGARLADRLASLPAAERSGLLVEVVRAEAAAVLGHASGQAVDPERSFRDVGFDSLAAVELRNRLTKVTGRQLSATVVFDYPNASALGEFLLERLQGDESEAPAAPVVTPARSLAEEPIAIVGMSCRFPGGVSSPEDLWQLLAAGRDAISPLPEDRGWDLEALYDPDPDHPGTSHVRVGGFLDDVAGFDAEFFGISPREALATDPQQRLLLEATWEALEAAGIDPVGLRGTEAGVFAGVMPDSYGIGTENVAGIDGYGVTSSGSVVSGRLSYALGLEGPAVSVDTACSSSLVAIHLALRALRAGECSLALAGGVTAFVTPGMLIEFSRMRALADDGRCKAFAAGADGTGLSEGAGLLVLEPLSVAEREGHRVLATIRGSAVNQDGASNGLTAPNGPSQERVIRRALADAGLAATDVDLVEAHGTGTELGDPIEAGAILATYGQGREGRPLYLGSLKSNIGHAQAAAGVAGVIKAVLAMNHGTLPKTLHVDGPSPHVDWESGEVQLLTEPVEWAPGEKTRRAGVSAFGMSGTNAHVILEEAPPSPAVVGAPPLPAVPLLLSAKSDSALARSAARLAAMLDREEAPDPAAIAADLATRRARLEHRAAVVGADREELLAGLDALATSRPHRNLVRGRAPGRSKVALMLSGQGSQRAGMGAGLQAAFPAYAEALDALCAELDPLLGLSLKDHLFATEGTPEALRLDRTELTQPALFATEVALFRLLEGWGPRPDFLIGHSIGELAAAHLAGVLSLSDACALVAARGRLMGALPEGGAMVAIEAGEDEIAGEVGRGLSIAALNAPGSVVVSGEEEAALELAGRWAERGRRTTRLRVSHAFHSELMEPMLSEFAEVAEGLSYAAPTIPIVSGLSGRPLSAEEATSPAYWVRQAREPVRFGAGIAWLRSEGAGTFLELGPGGALCAMAQASLPSEISPTPFLREGRAEAESVLLAAGQAHADGAALDWAGLLGRGVGSAELPTYPFQRTRYWLEPDTGRADAAAIGQAPAGHPLLGATTTLAGSERVMLSGRLSLRAQPWLADHVVGGAAIVPGTAFLELALRAAAEVGLGRVEELTMSAPLPLPAQGGVALQVGVGGPDEGGRREIEIHSRPEAKAEEELEWTLHATGTLGPATGSGGVAEPLDQWPPSDAQPVEVEAVHDLAAALQVEYGPAFAGLAGAWRGAGELFGEVAAGELADADRYAVHPALLDSVMQVGMLEQDGGGGLPRVPFSWRGAELHRGGAAGLRARLRPGEGEEISVAIADETGAPLLTLDSVALREVDPAALRIPSAPRSLFELDWTGVPAAAMNGGPGGEAEVLELVPDPKPTPATAAEELCGRGLDALKGAIAAGTRLAVVTRGAQVIGEGEVPDAAGAALWGLVRSAQAEHPGLFALIDLEDGAELPPDALALTATEHQLAVRDGALLAPRLAPAEERSEDAGDPAPSLDPERTVLVTGATGGLGPLLARHLVEAHGARHLLLVSRGGPEAEGAAELRSGLEELGAQVEIGACDVGERDQVAALIASIDPDRPLGAVFHCAGTLDDGLVDALDRERLAHVLAPKADAAWHLHELTAGADLTHFVLFSSIAGTFNNPGQGNYAAANAFLDALAWQRGAAGLPAVSLGWGGWERAGGMRASLGDADLARLARGGVSPLSATEGLELLDRALALGSPHLLPVALDRAALRAAARAGSLPPLFRGLIKAPARSATVGDFAERLAAAPADRREDLALDLVRSHVAAVLGHAAAAAIEPGRAFTDLGFDSLAAVELRNRLAAATGLQLQASLVFDYPSSKALADFLVSLIAGGESAEPDLDGEVERLAASLAAIAPERRQRFRARLQDLLLVVSGDAEGEAELVRSEADLESVSDEELFELIDKESS
ncbi:MAG TPA: SDR family NAD(P)-dependent oxidoreductase [Solirubrobacterales bacterium]|nr:SDR family NAD(P)-dependent oxidoreductase [Solirubrobacterales bacterium]